MRQTCRVSDDPLFGLSDMAIFELHVDALCSILADLND